MSDRPEHFPEDGGEDRDLLAGISVLGVLELDEVRVGEDMARADPAMTEAIEAWQNRLAPLAGLAAPVAPPGDLWPRIATTLGMAVSPVPLPVAPAKPAPVAAGPRRPATVVKLWRSTGFWRVTTAAALALAASFAGIAFLNQPTATRYAAALAPPHAQGAAFIAETLPDGSLLVRPVSSVSVAAGKDLELWELPAGAKRPKSLGVLPSIGRRIPPGTVLAADTQLMISLEPQGGSPTGQPTGPVLWAGTLAKL